MATALIYVLVLLAVAAVIFVGVSALFGRGEELAPIPKGASPTWLPDAGVGAADVRAVRFQQAVRGYRMAEVDWVLEHVAGELQRLHERVAELERADDVPSPELATDVPSDDEPPADGPPADEPPAHEPPADELLTAHARTQEHTEA